MSERIKALDSYRHSPGLLAGVALCHVGVLAGLLYAKSPENTAEPPRVLSVSLIEIKENKPEPEQKTPEPPPRPQEAKPLPSSVLAVERPVMAPPQDQIVVEAPKPRPEALPAVLSTYAVAEAPKPAPPLTVVEPKFDADYLDNPKPPYPRLSSKLGETGKVYLRVLVKSDGSVKELELHRSSGFERLDRSALNTVESWRFVPARQGSKAIDGWVIVPINFTLGS